VIAQGSAQSTDVTTFFPFMYFSSSFSLFSRSGTLLTLFLS
jgi:hypothetical protein